MKKTLLAVVLFSLLVPGLPGGGGTEDVSMAPGGGPGIQVPPLKPVPKGIFVPAADLTVCVSNGKTPPIGGKRDIHVRVTNNGADPVDGLRLAFAVEGKGIEYEDIGSLGGNNTYVKTRNHSWSTVGRKSITAMVYREGYQENIVVNAAYRVRLATQPSDSSGEGDVCRSRKIMTPVDRSSDDLLTVCISDGKMAPIGGKRDIHVWVRNNSGERLEGINVFFYVEDKRIETHRIDVLGARQTQKITRNHSWATAGTKSLSANVRIEGRSGVWAVNGAFRVRPAGSPMDSSGAGIKCSDGSAPGDLK
ncbi:MAG: hypothetical protein R6X21_01410 [Candidatus Aminicenantes bacterium]